MGLGDDIRTKVWKWMEEATASRQMTPEEKKSYDSQKERKRTEKFVREVKSLSELLSNIEQFEKVSQTARDIIGRLRPAITILKRFSLAVTLGDEAAKAAEEARQALVILDAKARHQCQKDAKDDVDQYDECVLKYDRQWQKHAVTAVLSIDNQDSWIRKLWPRWRAVVIDLLL